MECTLTYTLVWHGMLYGYIPLLLQQSLRYFAAEPSLSLASSLSLAPSLSANKPFTFCNSTLHMLQQSRTVLQAPSILLQQHLLYSAATASTLFSCNSIHFILLQQQSINSATQLRHNVSTHQHHPPATTTSLTAINTYHPTDESLYLALIAIFFSD